MPKRKYIVSLKDGRRIPIEAHDPDEAKSIARRYLTKPGSGGKKPAEIIGVGWGTPSAWERQKRSGWIK